MAYLSGKNTVSLDPKGRIAVPARLRSAFPEDQQESIVLTRGVEPCITGYYIDKWEQFKEKLVNVELPPKKRANLKREFIGRSVEVLFDKQGRVTISADLIEHAQLEGLSSAVVLGCDDYLEIWNPDVYAANQEEAEDTIQDVMDEIYL